MQMVCKKCRNIEFVNEHKYLGVMINSHLRWDIHTEYVAKKIQTIIPSLYVSEETLMIVLYYALIESRLRYGVQAWGIAKKSYVEKIDKLQRKCLKLISKTSEGSLNELMKAKNVLNITGIYLFVKLWEYLTKQKCTKVEKNVLSSYSIRKPLKYKMSVMKTKYGEQTDRYIMAKLLNAIPDDISNEKRLGCLKQKMRRWLQQD